MPLKISIITPSFNQVQFLPDNLQSVSDQSYSNIEHIVVDPGSSDGSTEMAAESQGVTLIAEPDRGQSDGISKGFFRSTGDVLTWLNSDDFYPHDQVLARVAAVFEAHPEVDIVYGNVDFVDESGNFLRKGFVNPNSDQLLDSFAYQVGIVQPGVFMRRSVFEKLGGPSDQYEYCMDYEYWVRMAAAGLKWKFINEKLAHHRWWSGMKTSSGRDKSLVEHMRVNAEYFGYIHWKWIDRYAEFLSSGKDGVVNHLAATSPVERSINAQKTIHRFVTQEMIEELSLNPCSDKEETKRYFEKYAPEFFQYYFSADSIDIGSETNWDPDYASRVAWRIMSARSKSGGRYAGYHVPKNFDRYFDATWFEGVLQRGLDKLRTLAERRRDVCVVVGNGPSLSKSNLELLRNADVIVSNFAIMNKSLLDRATILTVTNDLVAKQGAIDFNAASVSKVFPFWLANNINETPETIFVPATVEPRFNTELNDVFSWRSTVSYFNLQLAYTLGYQKVLMIGFDHSYSQPDGVEEGDLIEQDVDDENHFDPRYFKGKTWQAADTLKMEEMYKVAKSAFEAGDREIINCTVGGELEVFRRDSLENQLSNASEIKIAHPVDERMTIAKQFLKFENVSNNLPRVLLIDMTRIGDGTATGELKASLFAEWPKDRLIQVYAEKDQALGYRLASNPASAGPHSESEIKRRIDAFKPDVILYRPVPDTAHLHKFAMDEISRLNIPLATWVMDDWPVVIENSQDESNASLLKDWRELLQQSAARLSISDSMSTAFKERYGVGFIALANGVEHGMWRNPIEVRREPKLQVRYAGALAENMTQETIALVARAVESLAQQGIEIEFKIKTRPLWQRLAERKFKGLSRTSFIVDPLPPDEYRAWLSEADVVVVGYNFDDASRQYIQYSLANKLPECLACGAVLLAVGPSDVATMELLEKHGCGLRVTENSVDAVTGALMKLASSPERRIELANHAREIAFREFNIADMRRKITEALSTAAAKRSKAEVHTPEETRQAGAHVDETAVVAQLLSDRRGRDHVMIDVGAHFGTSAAYFHELGWMIHCFEPDASNREKLKDRYEDVETVSIDPRAVSEKPQSGVAFYTSEESTGISGLSAFRETHAVTDRVDITTVGEIVRDRNISAIDFLKIDVEGFDFSVLKGVPWDKVRPDVIECEFEDAKTVPLGHNWKEIAKYLTQKGYAIYISEWHPIIRYGIPHDWRRVIAFTEKTDIPENAWGNLLAFKSDPGLGDVQAAFSALTQRRNKVSQPVAQVSRAAEENPNTTASHAGKRMPPQPHTPNGPAVSRPFYVTYAEQLQRRSPRLFAVARLARRLSVGVLRRWFLVAPAAIIFGLVFVYGFLESDLESRLLIWGGTALSGLLLVILYLGWWTYHRVRALAMETAALRLALSRKIDEERAQRMRLELKLQKERDDFARRLDTLIRQESRRLSRRIFDHDACLSALDKQLSQLTSQTDNLLDQLRMQTAEKSELEEIISEIDAGLSSLEADLDLARKNEAASRDELTLLRQKNKEQAEKIETVLDERSSLQKQVSELEARAKQLAEELLGKSGAFEIAASERDTLKAQLAKIVEFKSQLAGLSKLNEIAHHAEQKRKITNNNLEALQAKYKALAELSDAQAEQLEEAYAHIKAAREQLKSLGSES